MLVAAKAKERLCMRESFKRVPSNSQLEGHVSGGLVSLRERSAIPSLYDHYMVTNYTVTSYYQLLAAVTLYPSVYLLRDLLFNSFYVHIRNKNK